MTNVSPNLTTSAQSMLLEDYLRQLRLPTFVKSHARLAEDAAQTNQPYTQFLFALAEWGIERRENLKDLIPRLLEQAARPLTKRELWERVRRVRSVSRSCFRYLLRTHPAIGDYGVEGYGLKSWAGDQEAVRTGGELVQRYGEEGRVNNEK